MAIDAVVALDATVLSGLISYQGWARKQGYRDHTILASISSLKSIARHASLAEPESVARYITNANVTESRKMKLSYDYSRYCKFKGFTWVPPRYKPAEKLPFVPLESEVEQLISGMGRKMAAFLQLLKETGARPGEAWALKWQDIDSERRTVAVVAEKHSRSRQLKITDRCLAMLNSQPKIGPFLFHETKANPITSMVYARRAFQRRRLRLAQRLQNPRLMQISFKTLRHFKATMEYHRTKDILHVMQLLGHRNIRNTLVYTHLVNFEGEEYICKAASTVNEAKALVEEGFEYVTRMNDVKLFRKRK